MRFTYKYTTILYIYFAGYTQTVTANNNVMDTAVLRAVSLDLCSVAYTRALCAHVDGAARYDVLMIVRAICNWIF